MCDSGESGPGRNASQPQIQINCVAVLPVATPVDYDGAITYQEAQNLKQGAEAMNHLPH